MAFIMCPEGPVFLTIVKPWLFLPLLFAEYLREK